jgi:O-succinylbenzoate synthase
MLITACEAFSYSLPLTRFITVVDQRIKTRQGFIVCLTSDGGHVGIGEVSPLSGLHLQSLGMTLRQFWTIQPQLLGRSLPHDVREASCWLAPYALYDVLRYGLEMALLNLLAAQSATTLAGWLNPNYSNNLPINGLWLADEDIKTQAQRMRAEGYKAVKLKVGRHNVDEDIQLVLTASEILGNDIALRLDANRRWDLPTAVHFGKAVADCPIEYIEEPCAKSQSIADFYKITGLPVALDESLYGYEPTQLKVPAGVIALVLKPAMLGGLVTSMGFIKRAEQFGMTAVISSVFDSGVGLAALAGFAAALCGPEVAAGLDTYRWLGEDLLQEPFRAQDGSIDVDKMAYQARNLRYDRLSKCLTV